MASRIERAPGLLTARQVRTYFNLSKTTLYDRVSRGTIPYVRIGSSIRFDPVRVAAWLREHEVGTDENHEKGRKAA
jgi:excisionase family DNA binding protein